MVVRGDVDEIRKNAQNREISGINKFGNIDVINDYRKYTKLTKVKNKRQT